MTAQVECTRGGAVESIHRVHVAVVEPEGSLRASLGDVAFPTYFRSAAKPIQALPLVEDGVIEALGIELDELALCCASHNSEARHVATARRLLARAGLDEKALECGGHPPLSQQQAERFLSTGTRPGPVHSNCSGKHAGMLALAVHHGWSPSGYRRPEHPVQIRMLAEVARWCGIDETEVGVGLDGCGVPCFQVPLRAMAVSFARFGQRAHEGEPPARVLAAMAEHPGLVAGEGRLCTALIEATEGRIVAKVGAEGVYTACVPSERVGVALKVEDGARRAAEVALVRVLEELGLLSGPELDLLGPHREIELRNTLGEPVGVVRAAFALRGGRS